MVALYLPEGTQLLRWNILEQRFREPFVTQGDSVRLLVGEKPYAVDCFFETGSGPAPHVAYYFLGKASAEYPASQIPVFTDTSASYSPGHFYGWKVDIITPFVRTVMGFDITDEVLDIVVRPDRSYVWKDEDEMSRLVQLGIYTSDEFRQLRAAGREGIELIEQGLPPFDDEWPQWRPSLKESFIPELPEGWQNLSVADSIWGALHRRMTQPQR